MNKRRNLEMSDFPSDGAVALLIWILCLAILFFTGAGAVLLDSIAGYVATWGMK